jgi:hypothetical protein
MLLLLIAQCEPDLPDSLLDRVLVSPLSPYCIKKLLFGDDEPSFLYQESQNIEGYGRKVDALDPAIQSAPL